MTAVGWLPAGAEELFGADATAEESYDLLTVDVPPGSWITALETARDRLGCTYFDWLSAVDEPGVGFRVAAHVAALGPVRRLLLRTTVPHEAPVLPTAVRVYAGAAWHERETHEMFGVAFEDHPALDHLLLPEGFEGHPLRKDFVLAARVAKAWPGAKEPGESDHGGPRRRQMLPPGVPDPNEWGPLKGQLPPAPARPARGAGRAAGERPARAAGERPARRTRTAAEGSVGQQTPGAETPAAPRRSRTAAEGSVSQASPAGEPTAAPAPRRSRSASQGSASQRAAAPTGGATDSPTGSPTDGSTGKPSDGSMGRPSDGSMGRPTDGSMGGPTAGATAGPPADTAAEQQDVAGNVRPRRARSASQGSASQREASPTEEPARKPAPSTPRSPDAPWHHARPAFDEPAAAEGEPEASQQPPDTPDGTEPPNEPDTPGEPAPSAEQASSREPAPSEEPDPAEESGDPRTPPNPPGGPQ
ncbi:NADH-quinone oxidoreductase subunit C [Streptomyces sp. PU10]|uniref:NADH-quinone oxidoreductase subunit C n=1 Tax=unclassified Streptomyces TaxID=2593676 RepID=UPI0028FC7192|nr:NADH-quinone oxidoreductase subunit C [Streptomyces sp. PU10]MDU0255565.1 NADH-quinone oxidoreductase subunit C [Streptomyces sp. PU10]WSU01987.1 NADH-quinone oxidoreductase subunit C [Streptomyces sp. NBC_01124]